MSYVGGPEQPVEADVSSEVVVVPRRPRSAPWATPAGIFAGVLVLALLTFGSSVALLTRVATLTSPDEEVTRTATPGRTATPAPSAVRVTAGAATAERLNTGEYRVTFMWTLEGAREGDTALLRFSTGSRVISEQRGALDATLFSSSTGRFTVPTSQVCSADGWSAELISIRGVAPVGEPTSRAPGVACP
jgi:hypothetical protein